MEGFDAALRRQVQVPFLGVGADQQVEVGGRPVGERVGGLDREH